MGKTKSVLGKGLSALIPGGDDASETQFGHVHAGHSLSTSERIPEASVSEIALDRIVPNAQQPRKDFSETSMRELANSIREHGVIQAITVRRVAPDKYELVAGERRWRAAKEAGLKTIPAYVLGVENDRKMLEYAIIENVQRTQLNPIEEAEAYDRLIRECNLTQEEVSEKIGKDRTTISNFLRLLKLSESIRHSLRKGDLGMGHAKAVMSLQDPASQESLWNRALTESLSVRRLEELARAISRDIVAPANAPKRAGRPQKKVETNGEVHLDGVEAIEQKVKQLLGTQVKVRMKSDRTGEIALHFYSDDDLERILELLLSVTSE
jgi:ParB family chromosome partitioning protein